MAPEFNPDSVGKYVAKKSEFFSSKGNDVFNTPRTFKTQAIMSVFDKNNDGKISKEEFKAVSKAEYQQISEQIDTYLKSNPQLSDVYKPDNETKEISIIKYDDMQSMLDDGYISADEIENKPKQSTLKGKNLPEVRDLKSSTQMTEDEMKAELKSYGIETDESKPKILREMLDSARRERALYDENSDKIDGHIGTYYQELDTKVCSILASIDNLTDEQVRSMYTQNENGDYVITFPMDKGTGRTVTVTQEEIDNKAVTIIENGEPREITGLTQGDADVTMLQIAFFKRFGAGMQSIPVWAYKTQNVFVSPDQTQYGDNQHVEDITDFSDIPLQTTFNILSADELLSKGIQVKAEVKAGENPLKVKVPRFQLSDGRQAWIENNCLTLSDGTKIEGGHALAFRGYDKETKEIILTSNEFHNLSEIRVPQELMRFFEMTDQKSKDKPDGNFE